MTEARQQTNPRPSIRSAILMWLLADAPTAIQMTMTPAHVDALEAKIREAVGTEEQVTGEGLNNAVGDQAHERLSEAPIDHQHGAGGLGCSLGSMGSVRDE